jgi:hypothetical protein
MRYYLLPALAFALACQTAPKPRGPVTPTDRVNKFLGNSMMSVISAPDSVQALRLEPRLGVALENVDGFKILKQGPALTAAQVELLKNIIHDEKSYDFDHVKRHPMDPTVSFRFKKGNDVVHVSVSFAGNLWQFSGFGQKQVEDNDAVRAELLKLAQELFPGDAGLTGEGGK